jgi:hypothetical protein
LLNFIDNCNRKMLQTRESGTLIVIELYIAALFTDCSLFLFGASSATTLLPSLEN